MTQQFVLFWMNKNLDLGCYSPENLQKTIKEYTTYVLDNLHDQTIQKSLKEYENVQKTLENNHNTFWVYDQPKQSIHYSAEYSKARRLLKSYKNILIFAGAGMSADSGLPVFRTEKKTLFTPDFSNTQNIRNMFDLHQPHFGYSKLLDYCKDKEYFVMTSNIDGYFARAGFDENKIVEVHGNVYYTQCDVCKNNVYDSSVINCPDCEKSLRPNVLQFGDKNWIDRTSSIEKRMTSWIKYKVNTDEDILIIEIGAGIHIPTIRDYSEILLSENNGRVGLIRVNPEYWQIPDEYLRLRKKGILLTSRVPANAIDFFKCFM